MDQNQKRYAVLRVKEVVEARTKELKAKFTIKTKEASDKDKLRAIRNNDVCLRSNAKLTMTLGEAFDFSALAPAEVLDGEKYDRALTQLFDKASKVKDLIMLGSSGEALAALNSFLEETSVADPKSKTA
jgi:hypothetical protein